MKTLFEDWLKSPQLSEVRVDYVSSQADDCRPSLTCPDDANRYLRKVWNLNTIEIQEEFYVLLLNGNKKCIGWTMTSRGGKKATIVEVQQIVTIALLTNAASIIIAHNHPSGTLSPSTADINLTQRIIKALKIMGLELDDHIILTREDYFSFRSAGRL